ncbi:MAG: LysR family transcriptional regulator [Rhodoferax sp.]|nr:LysR family transcriptional regulator [Rhodoferax sp.]
MRTDLPSLDLLRVFEACARLLSFTAAATELGTTQPAISQQIQRLERQLSARLFERVYRGIELTALGGLLLDHVQEALEAVRAGVEAVNTRPTREVLAVATDFAFAAYWLIPRLARFYQLNPQIDVSLITSNRPLVVLGGDVDLGVAFGDGQVRGAEAQLLFPEEVFPVCSPQLLTDHRSGASSADLPGMPLLHLKAMAGQHWFEWPGVFQAFGLKPPPAPALPGFDNYTQVLSAALAGQGVAIGWNHLVDDLLQQGLLCRVVEGMAASAYGYHLMVPQRKRRMRLVRRFVDWMHAELAAQAA